MPRRLSDLPDAELAVLQFLWERGPATIRQMSDTLYPGGTDAHYATVQKLLERLESKACVARDASARAHTFRATVDRSDLIDHRLRVLAEKLCEGSLTPLLTHLVRAQGLSEKEWHELRSLVDELAPKAKPRNPKRRPQ